MIKDTINENVHRYATHSHNSDDYENIELSVSDQLFFDALKLDIRWKSIQFSAHKKKQQDTEEKELENKILIMENKIDAGEIHLIDECQQFKYNLESIREHKLRGIMWRGNALAYEQGEKPSRYFCNLEKKKYISKTINKINVNGQLIRDPVLVSKKSIMKICIKRKVQV